jgi:PQQ-dependent catabolism-associated CXXCW motif protein
MRSLAVALLLVSSLPAHPQEGPGAVGIVAADADFDPVTGLRTQNYRSPVTRPVVGGTLVALAEVDRLRAEGAALIDVMPQRGGFEPVGGRWRIVDRRETIPGAVWLPETGRGRIEPRLAAYLARWLETLSGGHRDHPLIFFCMGDCWMSWNAVRRAADLGYRRVYWFADGTDGWSDAGRPLVPADPPAVPSLGATSTPSR